MIILDIEMSGTSAWKNGILSIGALDFENPTNEFYEECQIRDGVEINNESLAVNGFSLEDIKDSSKKTEKEIVEDFFVWAMQCGEHTIGGLNPMFDVFFLQFASGVHKINFPLAHRSIDLHSVCFSHMIKKGITPPTENHRTALNSGSIMRYVGISEEPKPHNALRGAKWEAEAFSRLLYDKKLYNEFEEFSIPWI